MDLASIKFFFISFVFFFSIFLIDWLSAFISLNSYLIMNILGATRADDGTIKVRYGLKNFYREKLLCHLPIT